MRNLFSTGFDSFRLACLENENEGNKIEQNAKG